jgi:hypothetical protein
MSTYKVHSWLVIYYFIMHAHILKISDCKKIKKADVSLSTPGRHTAGVDLELYSF